MSTPIDLAGPSRYRLRDELRLTPSQVCQPGKIMWWAGAKLLDVSELKSPLFIPRGATGAMIAAADYERLYGVRS
jgi:hypothetical protein